MEVKASEEEQEGERWGILHARDCQLMEPQEQYTATGVSQEWSAALTVHDVKLAASARLGHGGQHGVGVLDAWPGKDGKMKALKG